MSADAPLAGVRRLGLFGGSFDPVHVGHLHVARAAQRAFDLDHVLFVPAARPPHKPDRVLADGADRLAMLERVVRDEPRWSTTDLELRRAGPSYTVDTVRALGPELGLPGDAEVFLLIGGDNLDGLPEWREVEELLRLVRPVIVFRAGEGADGTGPGRRAVEELGRSGRLSAGAVAALLAGFLALPPVEVSSTSLRRRLAAGEDVGDELPDAVREYAVGRGIYRGSGGSAPADPTGPA